MLSPHDRGDHGQIERRDLNEDTKPVPPIEAEMSSFVGRRATLAEAMGLLKIHRLVTLVGTGGVGKTALLLRIAHDLDEARAYEDGVVVVRLGDLAAADDRLESTIAVRLGIHDNSVTPGRARLVEFFRNKRMLLMLDNCEHLVEEPGTGQLPGLVSTLLKSARGLTVMATSRGRLGVKGERALTVPLMCTGPADDRRAATWNCACEGQTHEAQQLLLDRAAAIERPVPESDYPVADRVCRMLDGIPLAIELASGQLDIMTLREFAAHHDPLPLLVNGTSDQGNHRTMGLALDSSYRQLTEPARRVWALTSVFEGAFDLEAAQAICAKHGVETSEVLGLLARLVRRQLLVSEHENGHTRWRMLRIIRQYGQDMAAASGDYAELRRAHADYFLGLADRCSQEWFGPEEDTWMHRLAAEVPNLRAAQDHYVADPDPRVAERAILLPATAVPTRFLIFRGMLNEARRMLTAGIDAHRGGPTESLLAALSLTCWVALIQGKQDRAEPLLAQAMQLGKQLGVEDSFAPLLFARGTRVWLTEPDPTRARDEAADLLNRAAEAFAAQGQSGNEHMARLFEAITLAFYAGNDPARAFAAADSLLESARRAKARWCESWALWTRALAELLHGDPFDAGKMAQDALRLQLKIGDTWGLAWSVWLLAIIAAWCGEHERAAQLVGGANLLQRNTDTTVLGLLSFLVVQRQAEAMARDALKDEFDTQVAVGESAESVDEVYDLALVRLPRPEPTGRDLPNGLTEREYEVAGMLATGMKHKEVSERLTVSVRTVETHSQNLRRKLGLTSKTEVANWWNGRTAR